MDGRTTGLINDIESTAEDDHELKIKGAAACREKKGKEKANQLNDACTICLEPISERAVAVPCNHLTFDFICLVSWLQERSSCPLCNARVTEIQCDFRGPDDYKTYLVPRTPLPDQRENTLQHFHRSRGQGFVQRRSARVPAGPQSLEDPALEHRRAVYRERLYSLHVGANRISQYRDFIAQDFASSTELQRRARMFLRRELQVFSFLNTAAAPRGGNREFLLEYIVAILKTNELKGASGHAEDLLTDYLGRGNAKLLLHELEAWLRSPYTSLRDWDDKVQYADGALSGSRKTPHGEERLG